MHDAGRNQQNEAQWQAITNVYVEDFHVLCIIPKGLQR